MVYEMVQDAADDEEDAVRRSSGTWPRDGDEQEGGRREMGWNGFTLYRPPGVCARSLTFQLALQLETIAFSPDVESTPKPPPPPRCRASAYTPGSHAEAANSLETPLTTNMADYSECGTGRAVTHDGAGASQDRAGCGLRISRERARTFDNKPFVLRPRLEDFSIGDAADDANGNAWWGGALERTPGGRREGRRPNEGGKGALGRVDASSKVGHSRGRNMSTSPAAPYRRLGGDAGPRQSVPPTAVDIPARTFGNGDMVMVANLLAHPESLLKRLILHRANIDTQTGRDYFLKCVEMNKLDSIALGGCAWFDEAGKDDGKRDESIEKKWWETVCGTIRTNAFRLRELVVEGLEREGDALGMSISHILEDYFMRTLGRLATISLVRCGVSDEGAKAMARGMLTSPTLTYVDLSANVISDVGVEALARSLVGDRLKTAKDEQEGGEAPSGLKTLDLGQNRLTDAGGVALASVLPRSPSLRSLTVSYNFLLEGAARAFLEAVPLTRTTLEDVHCEGNLFDEAMCGRIKQALQDRDANAKYHAQALPTNRPETLVLSTAKLSPSRPLQRGGRGEVEGTANSVSEGGTDYKPTVFPPRGGATGEAPAEPPACNNKPPMCNNKPPIPRIVVADEVRQLPAVLHARKKSRKKPHHRQKCTTTSGRRLDERNRNFDLCMPSSSYLGEALGCLPFAPGSA